ncbi:hypothetical protein D3C84_1176090 [compost metagenome]
MESHWVLVVVGAPHISSANPLASTSSLLEPTSVNSYQSLPSEMGWNLTSRMMPRYELMVGSGLDIEIFS